MNKPHTPQPASQPHNTPTVDNPSVDNPSADTPTVDNPSAAPSESPSQRPVVGGLSADPVLSIKADLRSCMNGVASKAIKDSGMAYRLVYGVELPRLRDIASSYPPDAHLAIRLWQENIRECKMLAILLFPAEEFDRDIADLWLEDLQPVQAEIAQLLGTELLPRTSDAAELSFLWIAHERPMYQLCGYLCLTRLIMRGAQLSPDAETEFLDQAEATLPSTFLPLRKAVQNALLHFAETSKEAQVKVGKLLNR